MLMKSILYNNVLYLIWKYTGRLHLLMKVW